MGWQSIICILFTYCAFGQREFTVAFHRDGTTNKAMESYKVDINTTHCVRETNEKFLSIALDSGLIRWRWENFNFTSAKLQNLANGLSPAYLRIGGTSEDLLLFDPDKVYRTRQPLDDGLIANFTIRQQLGSPITNFTMTAEDVENIFTFARNNGWNIIFGLNLLLRDSQTHKWNSSNAELLMKYIRARGFSCDWELGNEPVDLHALVNWTTTGKALASDFKILRKLLNGHPEYGQMIFGPDVSSPYRGPIRDKFFKEFLTNIDDTIDGVTYHQYYTNNQASVSKFYDPELLDSLITEIQKIQSLMKESGASAMKLWLGETSSAYGGGVPGVSDSYVAGFMWLDKLGVAARLGHDVVVRQTFYGGSYSLINKKTLDPFPDYWSSFLYKQLVGSRVLEVRDGLSIGRKIRVYAHCASGRSNYEAGSLVLIALNTQHSNIQLILTNELQNLTVHQYLLTPGENNNLTSQAIRLNGKLFEMINDTFLPNFQPKTIIPPDGIILPPISYGFFVIPDARAEACRAAAGKNVMTSEKLVKF